MVRHWAVTGATLAVLCGAAPLGAQTYDWQYRWYWGAKGGLLSYNLPTPGQVFVPQVGGEWLITARRSALYVGFSQTWSSPELDAFTIDGQSGGPFDLTFDGMRRLQIGVVVFPTSGTLQPYLGGGFVIETLMNVQVASGSPSTAEEQAISDASSGGFGLIIGGVQMRMGRKLALYAQYQGSPQGRDFLLRGSAHSFEAGIRYAFLPSREDDVTTRR